MIYRQDADNVRRNLLTVELPGPCAYNAVISLSRVPVITPIVEPVTLAEVKEFSHVDLADDDNKITGLIAASRAVFEQLTGVFLIPYNVSATVVNGLGNITLFGGNVSNVSEDLSVAFTEAADITYDAGLATLPEGIKYILLSMIDNVLNEKSMLSEEVKALIERYKYA